MGIQKLFIVFVLAVIGTALPQFALATATVNDVAENITNSTALLPMLLASLSYMMGVVFSATGVTKTIDFVNTPGYRQGETSGRAVLSRFIIGGAFFSLPILTEAATNMITGGSSANNFEPQDMISAVSGISGGISGLLSLGTNLSALFTNFYMSFGDVPAMITGLSYLLGLLMIVSGLYHVRDHMEDARAVTLKQPVIRFATAGALFALPVIFEAMYDMVAGNGLGAVSTFFQATMTVLVFTSQDAGSVSCLGSLLSSSVAGGLLGASSSNDVGTTICTMVNSMLALPAVLTAISYVIGLAMGVWGILKIRDHVQNPSQTPLNAGLSRLVAGGAFFALPYLTVVLQMSTMAPGQLITSAVSSISGAISGGSANPVNNGFNESLTCTGTSYSLDMAMACFVDNIFGPMGVALNFFCFCAGMIFIMIGISRLIRSAQEGAKGPGGLGTISTFVAGGVLMSATTIIRAFSASMFGEIRTTTNATLTHTTGMSVQEQAVAHNTISAILKFLIVIGLISFARGIFIMRDVAEGKQQASSMAGITHMVGGALAVNMGPLLSAVQQTLNITTWGITF